MRAGVRYSSAVCLTTSMMRCLLMLSGIIGCSIAGESLGDKRVNDQLSHMIEYHRQNRQGMRLSEISDEQVKGHGECLLAARKGHGNLIAAFQPGQLGECQTAQKAYQVQRHTQQCRERQT